MLARRLVIPVAALVLWSFFRTPPDCIVYLIIFDYSIV